MIQLNLTTSQAKSLLKIVVVANDGILAEMRESPSYSPLDRLQVGRIQEGIAMILVDLAEKLGVLDLQAFMAENFFEEEKE